MTEIQPLATDTYRLSQTEFHLGSDQSFGWHEDMDPQSHRAIRHVEVMNRHERRKLLALARRAKSSRAIYDRTQP